MNFFGFVNYLHFSLVLFYTFSLVIGFFSYRTGKSQIKKTFVIFCLMNLAYSLFDFIVCKWQFTLEVRQQFFAIIYSLGFLSHLVYINLLRDFLGITSKFIRISKVLFSGFAIFYISCLVYGIIDKSSVLIQPRYTPHVNFIMEFVFSGLEQSSFSKGLIAIGGNLVTATNAYFFFRIYKDFRHERLLLFGLIMTFGVVANDIVLGMDTVKYIFPVTGLGYALEVIRLNSWIWKKTTRDLYHLNMKIIRMAKLAELGHLSRQLSHDLRSPLKSIQVTIEKSKSIEASERKVVLDQSHRILDIIEFYLKKSKTEIQKEKIQRINIQSMFRKTIEYYRDELQFGRININVKISGNHIINAKDTDLLLIFSNLIENALEAIKNQLGPWIAIESVVADDKVKVYFTDSGNGLPKELQDNIFRPQFTTREKGLGLGLNIVQSITHQLGGTVYYVKERINTTFCIELPKGN